MLFHHQFYKPHFLHLWYLPNELSASPLRMNTSGQWAMVAPDVALLAYHARYTRPKGGTAEQMWVSSIWQRAGAGWINIFSQDTPCDAPFIPV